MGCASIALLAACADVSPTSSGGFDIGMPSQQAWNLACSRTNEGSLKRGPILYIEGQRRRTNTEESICDVEQEALTAEQWWLIQPGLRERYVVLSFENGTIARIELKWRGWDP